MKRKNALDHKGKVIKPLILFCEGDIIDYQTTVEETIGNWISEMNIYDANFDRKSKINGIEIERDRAYFISDGFYEISIKKIEY